MIVNDNRTYETISPPYISPNEGQAQAKTNIIISSSSNNMINVSNDSIATYYLVCGQEAYCSVTMATDELPCVI